MVYAGTVMEIEPRKTYVLTMDYQLVALKTREDYMVGQYVVFAKKDMYHRFLKNTPSLAVLATVAAAFLLFLGTAFLFNSYRQESKNISAESSVDTSFDTSFAALVSVDINPSIELKLNSERLIVDAYARNEEGTKVLASLDLKTMPLTNGVNAIISSSRELGYLTEETDVILVSAALSPDSTGQTSDAYAAQLQEILSSLETSSLAGDTSVMMLFIEDSGIIQEAESNQLSLGKQLLYNYSLTTPNAMNISDIQSESVTSIMDSLKKNSSSQPLEQLLTGTPVTVTVPESSSAQPSDTLVSSPSVLSSPSEKPTVKPSVKPSSKPSAKSTDVQAAVFSSPSLNTGIDGNSLVFSWTPVNSGTVKYNGFTYTGFKYYKIVASATDSTPVYPENGYLTYIADCNASSCAITPSSGNYHQSPVLQPGTSYYFSVTYVFENGKFTSNTTTQTVPASGKPQAPVPSTEPSVAPSTEPAPAPLPAVSSLNLSVSSDGSSLFFNWTPLGTSSITYGGTEYSSFKYYKVVASETNPNPVYPADGYLTYLTDPNSSGWSVCPAGGGYNQSPTLISGKTYYFSITYVFDNGKISSNTVPYLVP